MCRTNRLNVIEKEGTAYWIEKRIKMINDILHLPKIK